VGMYHLSGVCVCVCCVFMCVRSSERVCGVWVARARTYTHANMCPYAYAAQQYWETQQKILYNNIFLVPIAVCAAVYFSVCDHPGDKF